MLALHETDNWSEQQALVTDTLCKLKSNIDQLEQRVNFLNSNVGKKASDPNIPAMTTAARAKIHNLIQVAKDLMDEIRSLMRLCAGDQERSNELRQLEHRAISEVSRLQRLSRSVANNIRQQASVDQVRIVMDDGTSGSGQVPASFLPEPRLQLQMDAEPAAAQLQQEEELAIRMLEDDILKVNEIFSTLAGFVHEQGIMVDSIEAHTDAAYVDMQSGARQLTGAVRHRNAARRKKIICAVVMIVILIIIGIVLAIYFRNG